MIQMVKKTVVGVIIPSYNPGEAIHNVLKTLSVGAKLFLKNSDCYIVVVDSSDELTQKNILKTAKLIGDNVILYFGNKRITKGRALFIGLNIIKKKKPDVVLFIDADLKSIKTWWIRDFCEPIINGEADFIGPAYIRDKYDSLITNHIIYPFVSSFFGANLRQPIGGDFGISKKMVEFYLKKPFFNPEVKKFGIDIWLSINAISNGFNIGQVFLGTKDHGKTIKNPQFPEKSLGVMFVEVVKTLFDLLISYKKTWQNKKLVKVKNFGKATDITPKPVETDPDNLWLTFKRLYSKYKHLNKNILDKKIIDKIEKAFKQDHPSREFSVDLWIKILYSYLDKYQNIKDESHKRIFIKSLLPMYFARIASFVMESKNWNNKETEEKIQNDLILFFKKKAIFFKG